MTEKSKDYTAMCGRAPVCTSCTHQYDAVAHLTERVDNGKGDMYTRPLMVKIHSEGATIQATERRIGCDLAHDDRGTNPQLSADGQSCDEYKEKPA